MSYVNPWEVGFGPSIREDRKLLEYYEEKGGLVFTEFNTTQSMAGRLRALDAIRFPQLEKGIYQSAGNYNRIKKLIREHPVELIEVHKWGLYGFGQLVGKSYIVEHHWHPKQTTKILITLSPNRYHPGKNPDPITRSVFDAFDIEVYVPMGNKAAQRLLKDGFTGSNKIIFGRRETR